MHKSDQSPHHIMIPSAARLGIELSKLAGFSAPKVKEEQYATPPEIAGQVIHYAAQLGDIVDKKVSDLGAGTGILGIGAILSGSTQCTFVEQDSDALSILAENVRQLPDALQQKCTIISGKIQEFEGKSETIIMNPPFGTKQKHADKPFFERAFMLAPTIYAFAKSTTRQFVAKVSADQGYTISHEWAFPHWRLKNTQSWHKKPTRYIDVTLFRLKKVR